jgi:hypothetical protein
MSLPTQSFDSMLFSEELEQRAEFTDWEVTIEITIEF